MIDCQLDSPDALRPAVQLWGAALGLNLLGPDGLNYGLDLPSSDALLPRMLRV